jgi:hypothetical protein
MGKDGNTTISALKGATQINSNSLSDHNPTSDSVTRLSEFLIDKIGRRVNSPEYTQEITTDINGDPYGKNGFDTRISIPDSASTINGSLDSNGNWVSDTDQNIQIGEKFVIRVDTSIQDTDQFGNYWAEAIGKIGSSLTVTGGNLSTTGVRTIGTDGDGYVYVEVEVEVVESDSASLNIQLQDGLNTDCLHYGDPSTQSGVSQFADALTFNTTDIQSDKVFIDRIDVEYSNLGGDGTLFGCDLNALDDGGTKSDRTFTTRVNVDYNDPANKFTGPYFWLFINDDVNSLGCPGDGNHIVKVQGTNCVEYQTESQNSATITLRVVLTENSDGSGHIDDREVTYDIPGTDGEGQNDNSFTTDNPSPNC